MFRFIALLCLILPIYAQTTYDCSSKDPQPCFCGPRASCQYKQNLQRACDSIQGRKEHDACLCSNGGVAAAKSCADCMKNVLNQPNEQELGAYSSQSSACSSLSVPIAPYTAMPTNMPRPTRGPGGGMPTKGGTEFPEPTGSHRFGGYGGPEMGGSLTYIPSGIFRGPGSPTSSLASSTASTTATETGGANEMKGGMMVWAMGALAGLLAI